MEWFLAGTFGVDAQSDHRLLGGEGHPGEAPFVAQAMNRGEKSLQTFVSFLSFECQEALPVPLAGFQPPFGN